MQESPKMDDFFKLERRGVITSKAARKRVFFLAAKAWSNLEHELEELLSTGSAIVFREMGQAYGRALSREAKLLERSSQRAIEILSELAGAAGWGDISLHGDISTGDEFVMSIKDCIFCYEAEGGKMPSCHFLVGIVLGASDELYGRPHEAKEEKCIRGGADSCKIVVRRVTLD